MARLAALVTLLLSAQVSVSFPTFSPLHAPSTRQNAGGRPVFVPSRLTDVGLKVIPDAAHPFIAPGPGDQRGPCPGLNTMANHGYIPRTGVASFAQIVDASQEAFNLDFQFASFVTAFAVLCRGNTFEDLVSIGGETPLVPPMPGNVDGTPGGLGKHNRFEGDVSLVHDDEGFEGSDGDTSVFRQEKFDKLVDFTRQFSDGNVLNVEAVARFRRQNFEESQARNPRLVLDAKRLQFVFNEGSFTLNIFANGTTNILTVDVAESFFKFNRFPENWSRRASPLTGVALSAAANQIRTTMNVGPGHNDENGNYVSDPVSSNPCSLWDSLLANIPSTLNNQTLPAGIFRNNFNVLMDQMHTILPFCPMAPPTGAPP